MTRLPALALLIALAAAASVTQAEPRRIYRSPDRWLFVEGGELGVARFIAAGPQGERTFGEAADAQGVFDGIKANLNASIDGLGIFVDPTATCSDGPSANLSAAQGWAYVCRYKLLDAPPPSRPEAAQPIGGATLSRAAVVSPVPNKPLPAATVAPKAEHAPAPLPVASHPPSATVTASNAAPVDTEADQLNGKVRAALDAAEARDRQKQADYQQKQVDYEAAKQKATDDFAKQMADHDAKVKAGKAEYEATMAAWRNRVAACKAGDASQCAESSAPPAAPR